MKKIGFIGAGNMATAIVNGLISQQNGKADFINVFYQNDQIFRFWLEVSGP